MDKSSSEYKRQYQREYHRKRRAKENGDIGDLESAISLTTFSMEKGVQLERERIKKIIQEVIDAEGKKTFFFQKVLVDSCESILAKIG